MKRGFISMQLVITILCAIISALAASYTVHTVQTYGTSIDVDPQPYGIEVQSEIQELKRRIARLER